MAIVLDRPSGATARKMGFTQRAAIEGDFGGFDALIRPDSVDLDGTFKAWDLDEGCWMRVNGWMCSIDLEA